MAKALAGASAPYLAEVIHNMTLDPTRKGGVNTEANLMAHAVLGAVVAQVNGNSALAGASGAVMGEYIAQQMYPGVAREDLTEEQRQTLSALGTLAAGLAGGLTGGSTADTVAGAQAGKNAVENNALLLLMAPPPPVAGQVPLSGANTVIAQKLDDAVKEFGREAVKQCLSGGDCSLPVQVALLAIQAMMGQGENGPSDTGGDQIAGSGLTNTGGDQTAGNSLNHTGGDHPIGQGATDTGNRDGKPDTGGSSTVTPIPEGPNKDDLAYLALKGKEAQEAAKNLGYDRRVPPQKAPFNSHGQPVFYNGKDYITPDVDSHNVTNGWKLFNRKGDRVGTYDSDLKKIKD
ncbi:hemagglutinin-like secreted protein [Yersinia frederiksenii]|uniref:Hemagglutinin-like secreted protein n=5 Tax=Yersinia TaxID=629 RepID=A0AAI9EQ86_YERFR|nr:hemagglutinin-like secreted protein [Yersinia frederiksenii]